MPEAVPGSPTQPDGSLAPTAAEAEALIGEALALDAGQPLALHLHIHLAEASSPQRSARAPCVHSRATEARSGCLLAWVFTLCWARWKQLAN